MESMNMEMKNIMKNQNNLYHYGVKGMKWRKKKYRATSLHPNSNSKSNIDYNRNKTNLNKGLEEYEYIGTKESSSFDTNSPMDKISKEQTKRFLIVSGILKLRK